MPHHEYHRIDRIGWLRAALLGANDGLISTASLIVGMAVAAMPASSLLLAALSGLVAGALSMAADSAFLMPRRSKKLNLPSAPAF
jgi:VIT1/CCC1 family predicted Fe2+/Mn2+ transporter